jgi:hypothetical protein
MVDIIEERLRHVALVLEAKIFDAGDMLHEMSQPFLSLLVFACFGVI